VDAGAGSVEVGAAAGGGGAAWGVGPAAPWPNALDANAEQLRRARKSTEQLTGRVNELRRFDLRPTAAQFTTRANPFLQLRHLGCCQMAYG